MYAKMLRGKSGIAFGNILSFFNKYKFRMGGKKYQPRDM
jgi:hypothetical protein